MKIQSAPAGYTSKPAREHWSVGPSASPWRDLGKGNLVTTTDLLRQTQDIPEKGTPAIYCLQRDCELLKPTTLGQYSAAALAGSAKGALFGAAVTFGLALGGSLLVPSAISFLQAVPYMTAASAVGGAVLGVSDLKSQHNDYARYGESIQGTLKAERGADGEKHLVFLHDSKPPVDLQAYAQAPATGRPGQWWDSASPTRTLEYRD